MTYNQITNINDVSGAMRAVAKAVTERDIHALDAIRNRVHLHCSFEGGDELENIIAVMRKTLLNPVT